MSNEQKRDMNLFDGQYMYIQDGSKGIVKIITGPNVVTPSAQDKPVAYDHTKGTFVTTPTMEDSLRKSAVAVEGYYIELLNPAKDNVHPNSGSQTPSAELIVGRKINIPGPAMFALWPGQVATVIRGHHLRSNQYLLARVYNDEEAKKNWGNAVVKRASALTQPAEGATEEEKKQYALALAAEQKAQLEAAKPPADLTVGKLFIIRGTEVSFYIPPTGITVVPESTENGSEVYARDALTLERLEYAVLVDENGKKRYARGPNVVFPNPTERFVITRDEESKEKKETKKFRAVELNNLQGIHIKVIADYEEDGKQYKAGEELFIKGDETPIYYPREEHAAIKYDGKTKHFATAIPAGEARYVMNRMNGEIKMVKGPTMLLPDPRTQIIVRRPLSDKQCQLWYPGNHEALIYNQSIRAIAASSPTTRQGAVSEGEIERNFSKSARMAGVPDTRARGLAAYASASASLEASSNVSREQNVVGDELTRSSGYTQPRTLTLETKYQGVPLIDVWTNYAVQVVSKMGGRRIVVGPHTVMPEYEESLEVLEMSTGKPKTTDHKLLSVYLRVENNKVSDKIYAETLDHVQVELSLSYVIDFVGDNTKWFAVENYVKFLCDHLRSILKSKVRKFKIDEFYAKSTEIIREVLGQKGIEFKENNMLLKDIEVLGVDIKDDRIRSLMSASQHNVVKSNIEIADAQRALDVSKQKEIIEQELAKAKLQTAQVRNEAEREIAASQLALELSRISNEFEKIQEQKDLDAERFALEALKTEARLANDKKITDAEFERREHEQKLRLEALRVETEQAAMRFKAVASSDFTAALLALNNNEVLVQVAEAMNLQRAIGGDNIVESLNKVFAGTPLEAVTKKLTSGQTIPGQSGNGSAGKQAAV